MENKIASLVSRRLSIMQYGKEGRTHKHFESFLLCLLEFNEEDVEFQPRSLTDGIDLKS